VSAVDLALIDRNAARAAGRYKRRCWWVEYDELYQAASLAQVEAWDRFDASWGRPREAYLWRAAFIAVRTLVLKSSAPVSSRHRPEALVGLHRDTLDVEHAALTSAAQAERADRARRVRERVASLFGEDALPFALGVITDEWRPREIAAANNMPVQQVYAVQQHMLRVLECDPVLHQLWREDDGA